MYLRCKPQLNFLRGRPQANLPSCFLTRRPLHLTCAPLPSEPLFEREGTPGAARLNLFGSQAQQQQIGHNGQGYRAFNPCSVLGHLGLPQAHDSLQFFDAEFHRPSSQVACHRDVSCGLRQIGHEQFSVFGAVVTPPATEHYGDISDLPQLRTFGKRPEDPASGAGHDQRHADLAVMVDRQMGDQIPQVLAIGQLPGVREGNDKEPVASLNGLQISPRGVGGIGHHYDLLTPCGQDDLLEHLPKEGVLRLIAGAAFGLDQPKGQGYAVHIPLGQE